MDVGSGFALDEYMVVSIGLAPGIKGGTMAKAVNVPGGLTEELTKSADKAPGPGYYFKDRLEKTFVSCARGGTFSKLTREGNKTAEKSPSVGQYDTVAAQVGQGRRTRGGLMTRNDRICAFAKMAERANQWNSNGPGKYDGVKPRSNTPAPSFVSPKTESRNPVKSSQVGPGYYNPNHVHTDFRVPAYSSSKEDNSTLMTRVNKDKHLFPFPGYKDMPESKVQDRHGTRKHCKKLLGDRKVGVRRGFFSMSSSRKNQVADFTPI